MKLLLTSAGIKNTSIHDALVDLLGKSIDQSNALCIPTATYVPGGAAWRLISGRAASPCEPGWKSLGVLELTGRCEHREVDLIDAVEQTDALLVEVAPPPVLLDRRRDWATCCPAEQHGWGESAPGAW